MKNLTLLTLICLTLFTCCDNTDVNILKSTDNTISKENVNNLILNKSSRKKKLNQKIAKVFCRIIQDESIFKNIFPKNLDPNKNFIKISKTEYQLKNDLIIVDASYLKNKKICDQIFKDIFIDEYNKIHPQEKIETFDYILKNLPKLYFGIPAYSIKDKNLWNKNGKPVIIQSYSKADNSNYFKKIDYNSAKKIIGLKNLNKLIQTEGKAYKDLTLIKDNKNTIVINGSKKSGSFIQITKNNSFEIKSYKINEKGYFKSVTIYNKKESISKRFNNLTLTRYIDIPECNNHYSFKCDSQELNLFLKQTQEKVEKTCESLKICLPICCNDDIEYTMFFFKPKNINCARITQQVTFLQRLNL